MFKKFSLLFLILIFNISNTFSQKEVRNLENKIAIQGYDAVSYFSGKAIIGKKEFQFAKNGAIYRFNSKSNLEKFKANPEKYEPEFGGWCAYAMGNSGEKVEIDPETFKIIDGKLYLFYNAYFTNTLITWNKNENNLLLKANKNWKKYIK